jgi:hypothetical protein
VKALGWMAAVVAVALVAVVAVRGLGSGASALVPGSEDAGGPEPAPATAPLVPEGEGLSPREVADFEPFRFDPDEEEDYLERGRDGLAHVLYAKSAGGVEASAARVAGYRKDIEAAAQRHGIEAGTLAAVVFLESGGRPEAMAAGDPDGAVGLGQILPGTATTVLDMDVDLARSKTLTTRIKRDRRRAVRAPTTRRRRAAALRASQLASARRAVDERFDPRASLDGAALYLADNTARFGREDLAVASYHMGAGNLEKVIESYVAPRPPRRRTRRTVADYELSYPRLFFDSTPTRNPATYRRLATLGDDSRTYVFRVEAAREILRLAAEDREELARLERLHLAKASAEEVLRPEEDNEPFEGPEEMREAYEDGDLVSLPNRPRRLGYRVDRNMGALATRLGQRPGLYRGLRPEALAVLLYIAKETRRISGSDGDLRVTSTGRDRAYQRALLKSNSQATSAFSLHTTGYAVDVGLNFRTPRERRAFVSVLERLRSLNVIDWVYEPTAVHFTVGPEAERYMVLVDGLVARDAD